MQENCLYKCLPVGFMLTTNHESRRNVVLSSTGRYYHQMVHRTVPILPSKIIASAGDILEPLSKLHRSGRGPVSASMMPIPLQEWRPECQETQPFELR